MGNAKRKSSKKGTGKKTKAVSKQTNIVKEDVVVEQSEVTKQEEVVEQPESVAEDVKEEKPAKKKSTAKAKKEPADDKTKETKTKTAKPKAAAKKAEAVKAEVETKAEEPKEETVAEEVKEEETKSDVAEDEQKQKAIEADKKGSTSGVQGGSENLFDALIERAKESKIKNSGLTYLYSQTEIDDALLSEFQQKANEERLIEKYAMILNGEIMNKSEGRKVLHYLQRCLEVGSENVVEEFQFYQKEREKCYDFSEKLRLGYVQSPSGRTFEHIVQVGLGGSILGSLLMYEAFEPICKKIDEYYTAEFISNIDKTYLFYRLSKMPLDRTLFIFVSKSGSTYETEVIKKWIKEYFDMKTFKNLDFKKQSVVITNKTSPLAASDEFMEKFFIDDNIGGRYSISSPCAILLNSIIFGDEICNEFLNGMRNMDEMSKNKEVRQNPAMFAALYSVHENLEEDKNISVCLPYAESLKSLPLYLQQLLMESNGKNTTQDGERLEEYSGQFFFGDRGTCAQHSFCQLLHQGTFPFSLEFIGFKDRFELLQSLFSQSYSLFFGDRAKGFDGGRSNTVLMFDQYSPYSFGQLISFYENKTMFQGFLYNVNSFDQPGVELGKKVLKTITSPKESPIQRLFDASIK